MMKALGGVDHYKRWDNYILKTEFDALRKEERHLQQKSEERSLTEWERERAREIEQEKRRISQSIKIEDLDRIRIRR